MGKSPQNAEKKKDRQCFVKETKKTRTSLTSTSPQRLRDFEWSPEIPAQTPDATIPSVRPAPCPLPTPTSAPSDSEATTNNAANFFRNANKGFPYYLFSLKCRGYEV